MKNSITRIISVILIFIIINSVFLPKKTYSSYDDQVGKSKLDDMTIDYDTYKEDSENGSSKVGSNSEKKPYKIEQGTTNSLIKNLVILGNIIPTYVRIFMSLVANADVSDTDKTDYGKMFTIQKLIFNKIAVFDINFFKENKNDIEVQKFLKIAVAQFYYMVRSIAIVASLLVLIYTGIRMALASIAVDKAKYKKMLMAWLEGFLILMFLPYIMIVILKINSVLLDFCETVLKSICGKGVLTIESTLFDSSTTSTEKGFSIIIPTILYWMLTFYQLKFFFMYGKRLFSTAFLIVISPLVVVQNMFDKVGDGESQAFKMWINDYALNVLIQPLHALLYMVFMSMACNIVKDVPILAVIFLSALSRGERVIRNIFRIKNSITVESMKDNLTAKQLSKIGS